MRLDKINTDEAFRYLGYGISAPDEQTAELAADCERKLLEVIDAKYTYKYFEIDKMTVSRAVLHCAVHR